MPSAPLSFADRRVVITGAGRGIGRAYALELARRGASIVVNDVSVECAHAVAAEVGALGSAAIAVHADVASAEACAELVDAGSRAFGGIDAVIANASINSVRKPFSETSCGDLQAMLAVNVIGAWSLLQAGWPVLA